MLFILNAMASNFSVLKKNFAELLIKPIENIDKSTKTIILNLCFAKTK